MKTLHDLATPCLVLDLDRFEANLKKMSRFVADRGVALRPHAKTHKCVEIARRQIAEGAIGICAATIAEAEAMARNGIRGLLITAEMVGEPKISRFIDLLKLAPDTTVVVDDAENVRELQAGLHKAGVQANLLIDLDIGQNRTGILPEGALALARTIAGSANLRLRGICAYAGHLAHVVGFEARRRASVEAFGRAIAVRDQLREDGHGIEIVSGASTGTYNIDSAIAGVTEIQAGSYVFMDVEYQGIGGATGEVYGDFEPALTVLATVVHCSTGKAIVDAGLKAFATDRAFGPASLDIAGLRYEFAGDEHGRLRLDNPTQTIRLGEKLRFVIPHCDPTVNLYDRIHCLRGDQVVDVWSVMERSGGYF